MYRLSIYGTAKAGKLAEAGVWASEVAGYVSSLIDADVKIWIERYGEYRMHWIADYENLSDVQAAEAIFYQDEGYLSRTSEGTGKYFVDGSLGSSLMQSW